MHVYKYKEVLRDLFYVIHWERQHLCKCFITSPFRIFLPIIIAKMPGDLNANYAVSILYVQARNLIQRVLVMAK